MRAPALPAVVTAFLLAAAPAAPAAAATAGTDATGARIRVAGEPGERNLLALRLPADPAFFVEIEDRGAPLRAEAGCTPVDPHTVRCGAAVPEAGGSLRTAPNITVLAGDGDDRVLLQRPQNANIGGGIVDVDGGAGDDVIVGVVTGQASGGPGDDTISGDPSTGLFSTTFRGGPGRDHVTAPRYGAILEDDDDASADHLVASTVVYRGRQAGIRVDLNQTPSTAEGDVLVGTNALYGTEHGDVLIGGPGPAFLYGFGGDDVLEGSSFSANTLVGGPGVDRLIGGEGDDTLEETEGTVTCAGGADVVVGLARIPGPSCETTGFPSPYGGRAAARLVRDTVVVRLLGDPTVVAPGAVRATVPSPGGPAVALTRRDRGEPGVLRFRVGPRSRPVLQRAGGIVLRYRASGLVLRVRVQHLRP